MQRRVTSLLLTTGLTVAILSGCASTGGKADATSAGRAGPHATSAAPTPPGGSGGGVVIGPTVGSAPPGSDPTSSPAGAPPPPANAGWTTYHGDTARSGEDLGAPPTAIVKKAWTGTVDGDVLAEPLIAGGLVVVATENDTVVAFDARTGNRRWSSHLGTPVPGSSLPCGDIDPSGITGTPVIDAASGTVWVVTFEQRGSAPPVHLLVGLDLATGAVRSTRPADFAGADPTVEQQRGALLLDEGRIVIAYGGLYGDCGAYHGAVVSVPESGFDPVRSWVVPTAREGGIWSPGGPVIGSGGRILVTTGNAASQSVYDDANAVVALSGAGALAPVDLFAPSNWRELSAGDVDLSSASAVVLTSGLVVAAGKEGVAYLLDGAHLGGVGAQLAELDVCHGAGVFGGSAASGTTVYLPCRNGLRAVDTANRSLRLIWALSQSGPGAPVLAGGLLWVLHRDGTVLGVDPITGRVRQRISLEKVGTPFPTLAAAGGWLYAPVGASVVALSGV